MEYFILVGDDGEMQGMRVEDEINDEELWFRAQSQCPRIDEVLPLAYSVRAALQVLEYAAKHRQIPNTALAQLSHIVASTGPMTREPVHEAIKEIVEIEEDDEDEGNYEIIPDASPQTNNDYYVYTELVGGGEGEMPTVKWFVYDPTSPLSPIGPFNDADSAKKGLKALMG